MKHCNTSALSCAAALLALAAMSDPAHGQEMDRLWGSSVVKLRAEDANRGQLFSEGNYAMFIHWGLYSNLANKVDGKTYYGIGEWIDAMEIAQLAKDAGMKYIVITSKHRLVL